MRQTFLLLISVLLLTNCRHHEKPPVNEIPSVLAPTAPHKGEGLPHRYMTSDLDLKKVLGPVPKPGSAQQKRDEDALRRYQKTRTQKQCDRAAIEVITTLQNLFGKPLGILTAEQVKKLQPLMDQVRNDGGPYIGELKRYYGRPRPYIYLDWVKPCIEKESSMAYPSGHATLGRLYARVLGEIFPKKAKIFRQRGEQISEDRVLAGVHHPSDIQSGKKLADMLFAEMMKSDAFKEDLKKYRELLASKK